MVERGCEVITRVVRDYSGSSLHSIFQKHVKPGTVTSTDEWAVYDKPDQLPQSPFGVATAVQDAVNRGASRFLVRQSVESSWKQQDLLDSPGLWRVLAR